MFINLNSWDDKFDVDYACWKVRPMQQKVKMVDWGELLLGRQPKGSNGHV